MTNPAEIIDLIVSRGGKFYQEFQQIEDDGTPISLVGKSLKCVIKESDKSTVIYNTLTIENEGMIILDATLGKFALSLLATETNIAQDYAIYTISEIDDAYPDIEVTHIIKGQISYI